MTEQEVLLVLNAIPELGPVRIKVLVKHFGTAEKVLTASPSRLSQVEGIGRKIAQKISSWQKHFDLKREIALIDKYKVKIITINHPDYPQLLKEIYDPPVVLYVRGSILPQDRQAIAIVGARRASYYGLNTAQRLAQQLSSRGFTIVSGLARGVDTAAHKGALLSKGGRTVAVFGCGIDRVYPPENTELVEKIVENGSIMTEFPFGMPPYKQNFPKRNRVISGLALGVIVIEAGRYSGSLITARLATEHGREVFSVPGRIDAVTSQGTNVLIKQGAKPVLRLEDVLEEFEYLIVNKNTAREEVPTNPSLQDDKIYQTLGGEGCSVDELVESTGLNVNEVWKNLVELELKGLIKRLPGSRYVRK